MAKTTRSKAQSAIEVKLLRTLRSAKFAIEEATDLMHYEDGLPVTALDGWEIERAYDSLCSVLAEVHETLGEAEVK